MDDAYFPNSYYAHVGGIPVRELNRMELTFLKVINFNLLVSPAVFETFRDRLRWYLVDHALTDDALTAFPSWASKGTSTFDGEGTNARIDVADVPSPTTASPGPDASSQSLTDVTLSAASTPTSSLPDATTSYPPSDDLTLADSRPMVVA